MQPRLRASRDVGQRRDERSVDRLGMPDAQVGIEGPLATVPEHHQLGV